MQQVPVGKLPIYARHGKLIVIANMSLKSRLPRYQYQSRYRLDKEDV